MTEKTCYYCGRVGTKQFTKLHDKWRCKSPDYCQRRVRAGADARKLSETRVVSRFDQLPLGAVFTNDRRLGLSVKITTGSSRPYAGMTPPVLYKLVP